MIRVLINIFVTSVLLNAYVAGVPKKFSNIPIDSLPQKLWIQGYWNAKVDSIHGDTAFVTLGKPAILKSIELLCPDSIKKFLKRIGYPKINKILDASEIKHLENKIINELKNNGYPFASCSTALAEINETDSALLIHLAIEINPGIQVILEYLEARIDGRTKQSVIEHLMLFSPGIKYSQKHIDRGIRRLRRAGIITLTMPPYPAIDQEGHFALVVRGKDVATNSFQGMVGTNGKDISGEIQLISRNLFGTGRKVNLLASHRKDQITFFFFFMEPFIGNLNISPQINVDIELADYIRQNYALGFEFPLTFDLSGYAGVRIGRNYHKQNPHGGTKLFGGEFSAKISTINDPIFPKHGVIVRAGITATKLENIDEGKTRLAISASTNDLFVKTYRNFSLWVRANIKGYLSPRFPDKSCWYPLGGWRNLRGFRENQFYGPKVGVISFEPRIFIGATWSALLFFDYGAYLDLSGWHKPKSYGAGVEYKNPPAAISIIYGISEGRAIDEGLVHIGMRLEM